MTTLLIIDAQKDFHPGGNLAIPTANQDALRIARLIREHGESIDRIVATLDTHQKLHIAHPWFWEDHPAPFTIISAQDIADRKYNPRASIRLPKSLIDPSVFVDCNKVLDDKGEIDVRKYALEYAKRLEERGRFQLCIWPEHCLIGSPGHGLVDVISEALHAWSEQTGRSVEWILKGQNLLTEMYSALEADVPVSVDTAFNHDFHQKLLQSEQLIVCGQAMSHCVNYTVRDIVLHWPVDQMSKIVVLTDCASAVPGFEDAALSFQKDMESVGVQLKLSSDAF